MNAREHLAWARDRAMEYVNLDQGDLAMVSLVSDLSKHEGTERIMTRDLNELMVGEYLLAGARGVKRFIEGLPEPVVVEVES